jgi:hypothetical protein
MESDPVSDLGFSVLGNPGTDFNGSEIEGGLVSVLGKKGSSSREKKEHKYYISIILPPPRHILANFRRLARLPILNFTLNWFISMF